MRYGLLTLAAAVVAAACAVSGDVGAKQNRQFSASRDCVRPIYPNDPFQDVLAGDPQLATIASQCGTWANDPHHGGVGAARARFYAGRANRMSGNVEIAIRQLEGAAAVGADYHDFTADERRVATLELIHAYWQAGPDRLDDAQARLDDGLNRSRVLPSNNAAVAYQQAMLQLARSGLPARQEAFRLLATWFPGDEDGLRDSGLSAEDIKNARSWLFRLGSDLGRGTLVEATDPARRLEKSRDGINYFDAAARTVQIACPLPRHASDVCDGIREPDAPVNGIDASIPHSDTATEIGYVLFGLGVSHLRAAGAPDSDPAHLDEPGGLDCLNGIRSDALADVNAAERAFDAIGSYAPNARDRMRWGQGCAQLAGLQFTTNPAVRLQRAIEDLSDPAPTTVNMFLTLADAQVRQNDRAGAQTSLRSALNMLPPNSNRRARVNVELARTYYYTASGPTMTPDLFSRTVTDVQNASLPDLQQSAVTAYLNAAGDNVEAQLVRGHIAMRMGQYNQACTQLRRVVDANPPEDRSVGVSHYLLSRCLTLQQQTLYANGRPAVRNPHSLAVSQAAAAYQLRTSHSPEYRRQACEAQIAFGDTGAEEYCSAGASTDGESLLYQGMYWLRRGMGQARGDGRSASYTKAMTAFVDGGASGGVFNFVDLRNQQVSQLDLGSLHQYGRNFVEWCVGLHYTQGDEVAKQVFVQAGMPECPRS